MKKLTLQVTVLFTNGKEIDIVVNENHNFYTSPFSVEFVPLNSPNEFKCYISLDKILSIVVKRTIVR